MKRRDRKSLFDNKIVSDIIFMLIGFSVMFISMITFSILIVNTGIMYKIMVLFAELSLCLGCMVSGFLYAIFKRRKGLYHGFINALRIYIVIFIAGLIFLDSFSLAFIPLRLSGALLSGALGGFYGVNSKFKKPI